MRIWAEMLFKDMTSDKYDKSLLSPDEFHMLPPPSVHPFVLSLSLLCFLSVLKEELACSFLMRPLILKISLQHLFFSQFRIVTFPLVLD